MKYAKLVNGEPAFAPRKLCSGNNFVYNPTDEMLIAQGYKPVVFTEPPVMETGYVSVSGWLETADDIVQSWTVEPESDIADAEVLEILLGGEST